MVEKRPFGGTLCLILIGILALFLLATAISELPSFGDVVPRPHAVEKHGTDATQARASLTDCKNLKSKLCPGKVGSYGLTVVFWCETGKTLCPGCYATIGGKEKTAFIRPCSQWRNCQ